MSSSKAVSSKPTSALVHLDKRELLARHVRGDVTAFPELVQDYRVELYTYLVRCGVAEGYRDDLFQEIFFAVHRSAAKFNPELPFRAWLYTIAVNSVRGHFRKQAGESLCSVELSTEVQDPTPHLDDISAARETARWLEQSIQKLPREQREAVLISSLRDFDQAQAAKVLKLSINTFKTHLRRARLALCKALTIRQARQKREVNS